MEISYTHARARLAELCDYAVSSCEPVIIRRRGAEDVAIISAAELQSMTATLHELRSPRNAERLLAALASARARGYREMAEDETREAEAMEWSEGLVGDVAEEPGDIE